MQARERAVVSVLRWARQVVGGFAAAFLAYVVCGAFVGVAVTAALQASGSVCPTDFFGGVGVRCDDPLVRTFWYAVADLPSTILLKPVATVWVLIGPRPGETLIVEGDFLFGSALIVGLCVVAFFAWHARSRLVAWLLAAAFATEIAFVMSLVRA